MMNANRAMLRSRLLLPRCSLAGRMLHIEVRATPNPLAREFVMPHNVPILTRDVVLRLQVGQLAEVRDVSPTAARLLGLRSVSEILMASDRVTVNVDSEESLTDVQTSVASILESALSCGPLPESSIDKLVSLTGGNGLCAHWPIGSVEAEIVDVLEAHVRPYVRDDGGDLRFCSFDHTRGVACIQLVGACSGCPSSAATLHGRVEALLRHFVPEVEAVEEANDDEVEALGQHETGVGGETISLKEHIQRLVAEGEATSVLWQGANQRPITRT